MLGGVVRTQATRAMAPIARRNTAVGQKRSIVDWMVNYPDKVRDTYLDNGIFELSLIAIQYKERECFVQRSYCI